MMTDQKIKPDTEIAPKRPVKHLCSLMFEDFHRTHPDKYKQMVQNAQFMCENCGRTSHRQEQVCNPVAL
jgi:hypothetical protein